MVIQTCGQICGHNYVNFYIISVSMVGMSHIIFVFLVGTVSESMFDCSRHVVIVF